MSGSREASVHWKPEWDEALSAHLAAGLSATQAAGEVNSEFGTSFSRCAVIGRAKRSGIPLRAGKGGRIGPKGGPSQRKPRVRALTKQRPDVAMRKAAAGPKLSTQPAQLRCDPLKAGTFHVTELEEGMCRWPTGDREILFCGLNQLEDMPYCGPHCRIAFQPPRPSTRPSYRPMRRG